MKKNTAQQLRCEFELAVFKDGESVEDYALRLNGMVANLTMLDEVVEETKVVDKILCSVPTQFKQIVLAICTLLDVSILTIVDVVGRLKAAKKVFEPPPPTLQQDGKLYLPRRSGMRIGGGEKLRTRAAAAHPGALCAVETDMGAGADAVATLGHHQVGRQTSLARCPGRYQPMARRDSKRRLWVTGARPMEGLPMALYDCGRRRCSFTSVRRRTAAPGHGFVYVCCRSPPATYGHCYYGDL